MFKYILKYTKMFVHKWLVVTCLWEIANGLKLNTHPHTRESVWWLRTWPFLCETFSLIHIEDVKKEIYLTASRYWASHTGRWGSFDRSFSWNNFDLIFFSIFFRILFPFTNTATQWLTFEIFYAYNLAKWNQDAKSLGKGIAWVIGSLWHTANKNSRVDLSV